MNITDLSQSQDVGASCFLAEIGPFKILVDAGINPKYMGYDAVPDFSSIETHSLDFILLTHCHLDHVGALPLITKKNPDTPIITSTANLTLAPRMLRNSYNVMLRQRDEHNLSELPLYSRRDIDSIERSIHPIQFSKPRTFEKHGESITITLHPAGHLPGATAFEITYKHRKILFSGDVQFTPQRLVPKAQLPEHNLDTLILETTRGAHARTEGTSRESEISRLIQTISHTLDRKGSVLIPAFALGRMQEMLIILKEAQKAKQLPKCPIFCSGLGLDLVDYFDAISRKTNAIQFSRKILVELGAKKLRTDLHPGEDLPKKGIYLLSSGMLVENTPSYAAAASLLDHPHNSVCFVGYCDPDTPGGKLLATTHGDSFLFEKLDYVAKVRAHIDKFDISGHADREELLNYILKTDPRSLILTHGDPEARDWFFDQVIEHSPKTIVIDPTPGKLYKV